MKSILIGMTAWGGHIDTFLNYCLPSLLAEGNLPYLAKYRHIIFNIHTDMDGFQRLYGKIPYEVTMITDVNNEEKYIQLGKHQNRDLQKAKEIGADYHCLMPDYVYSEDCFVGVFMAFERGHKAIARLVVSTIQEDMVSQLDRPRSARDLATLSLMHIHPGIRNWCITPTGYPQTHVIVFVGKDTLEMHSPHCHPVYIVNEAIKLTSGDKTLDCALDEIIEGDIYCPKPCDAIVIIELTPKSNRVPNFKAVELKEFARIFKWDTGESPKQMAIFNEGTIDAINRQMIGNDNFWDDNNIAEIKKQVYCALKE